MARQNLKHLSYKFGCLCGTPGNVLRSRDACDYLSTVVGVGGVDVFGAEAQADHAGGDAAQDREVLQQGEWEGEALEWGFGG